MAKFFSKYASVDVVEGNGGEIGVRAEDGRLNHFIRGWKGSESDEGV